MRGKLLSALSVSLVCILSGCGNAAQSSVPVLPQYSTESRVIGSTAESSEISETVNENGFYPEQPEQPAVTPNDEGYKRQDEAFTGFSGIPDITETPKLGNTQQNLTSCPSYCGLVCNNNGDVYYTALGYDNFLHRKKNGTDEVFLEKTVWGINIINGQMYCIMSTENPVQNYPGYKGGDIYRVDLDAGEMSLVLATKARGLAAFEDRLCFIYGSDDRGTVYSRVYECGLDGENIIERDGAFLGFVGEYYIGFDGFGENSCLINEKTDEKFRFTGSNMVYNFTVEDGYGYYQSGGTGLYRLDIKTGEAIPMMPDESFNNITYNTAPNKTVTYSAKGHYIGGHYILDGNAYLVDQEYAFKVSPDGETEIYLTPLKPGTGWFYIGLFGDGGKLYSMKYNLSLKRYKLVELQFTDEEIYDGIKTVKEFDLL